MLLTVYHDIKCHLPAMMDVPRVLARPFSRGARATRYFQN